MEEIIAYLQTFPPALVYLSVFFLALIENLFPPSPSDLVVVFGGSLVAVGDAGFVPTLLSATAGSTVGFVLMYKIGFWFGRRILDAGKVRFLPRDSVDRVEHWFARYGYWIIVGNRFLAGTRAVVSFFAGLSGIDLTRTVLLSFISALVWNGILVAAGYSLGRNWQQIGWYLSSYAQVVTSVIIILLIIVIIRALMRNRIGKK